jgi:hypothetical protein
LCHLNTAISTVPGFFAVRLTMIIWNVLSAELGVFLLLKLCQSWFPPLADNYPSQKWPSFWIHHMHAAASCWDERKTDMAPSRDSVYPLWCVTAPLCLCSQSTELLSVLCILCLIEHNMAQLSSGAYSCWWCTFKQTHFVTHPQCLCQYLQSEIFILGLLSNLYTHSICIDRSLCIKYCEEYVIKFHSPAIF